MTDIVHIEEINRLLMEQDHNIGEVLMAVCRATRDAVEVLGEDEAREILIGFAETLKACDRFYDATALVLSDHLRDIASKRNVLMQAIANMASVNGNSQEWVTTMADLAASKKQSHLRVVDPDT